MQPSPHQFDVPVSRFQVGSYTLAYRDQHPESTDSDAEVSSRPTILCVHGNPTWGYYYRRVFQHFASTHRVVAIDHLGCGDSDKPPRSQFPYRLESHQQNLADLVEHLDLRNVMLLAHDWGGAIGLGALLKTRERFSAITLLNTGAFPPPYVPWRIAACRLPVLGTLGVRGLNLFAKAAVTMAMNRNRLDPEVAAGLLRPYDSWANRVAIDAFVRDIPMSKSAPTYQTLLDLEQRLPSLANLPSLLVWGMKDWCFRPDCLRRFQQAWPNARSLEIDDAGHYVIEDAPEAVLEAIESFVADVEASMQS
ncbi:alpha/beta fold hydrolase [Roseiconus lacunae]|uniref:Alpha/beta fold hydrolase n=1 Tax=Roseiconus lacunae TaxID=2605694 RepID=A0ABT7PEA0_9BACT|nr:alpha/beta fold hydrolase [Roseiconus lacunae]MDM4014829.1 alpha/beta fold hydrolase [Roseiconus lacunae]